MTFVVTQSCCNDASCVPVCPVDCIRPRPGDPDFTTSTQLYIDPNTCIDCAACLVECPVSAIKPDDELEPNEKIFISLSEDFFARREVPSGRARVMPLPAGRPGGRPLRVAIVGTGPAGCYTADLLSQRDGVEVTMVERLPTPFGLIRYGVAPDHTRTRQISERFDDVLSRANVTCRYGVEIGREESVADLLAEHQAVVWAGGLDGSRRLGVPGEDLSGVVAARELVEWYNAHPDREAVAAPGDDVVIVGSGNVALDIARLHVSRPQNLARTAANPSWVAQVGEPGNRRVTLVSRGRPSALACTVSELQGLLAMAGVRFEIAAQDIAAMAVDDPRRDLLAIAAARGTTGEGPTVAFRFGLVAEEIMGGPQVREIQFLDVASNRSVSLPASLVVTAIGYHGREVPGLPFLASSGTIPHVAGRVHDAELLEPLAGLYCVGWAKRGPAGFIGTNKVDAEETVRSLLEDALAGVLG